MFTHTFNGWHFWQGTQFLASYEPTKALNAFESVNDCINWLFLNGHREAARSLNAEAKKKGLI